MEDRKIDEFHALEVTSALCEKDDKPIMYLVLLVHDDYTPMDFIVQVLHKFFIMNKEQAAEVILQVHNKGRGICGVFTKEVAASKMQQVNAYSKQHQHPLLCQMETA